MSYIVVHLLELTCPLGFLERDISIEVRRFFCFHLYLKFSGKVWTRKALYTAKIHGPVVHFMVDGVEKCMLMIWKAYCFSSPAKYYMIVSLVTQLYLRILSDFILCFSVKKTPKKHLSDTCFSPAELKVSWML